MKKILILSLTMLSLSLFGCVNDESNDELGNEEQNKEDNEVIIVPEFELVGIENYEYVCGDEFNYTGKPNEEYWGYDIGNGYAQGIPGWGNNELQYYTDELENAYVENGILTIKAIKEKYDNYNYSSARLVSKNKIDITYGYVEIRSQMPPQIGAWTALWMLPTENTYGGWPYSGEIDIMEHKGWDKENILGTLHTGYRNWYNGSLGNARGSSIYKPDAVETFVTYGMLWTEDKIEFYVDGVKYFTEVRNELSGYVQGADDSSMHWPYDQDFYFIFNIAMGGTLGGDIASDFIDAKMEIDYIRVFQEK